MEIKDLKNKIIESNRGIREKVEKDSAYQIGKEVLMARVARGYTQIGLAKLVGTKQPSIARLESGASKPNIAFLEKIATALETDLILPKLKINHPIISTQNDISIPSFYTYGNKDNNKFANIESSNSPQLKTTTHLIS